jgi:hypothetical protein
MCFPCRFYPFFLRIEQANCDITLEHNCRLHNPVDMSEKGSGCMFPPYSCMLFAVYPTDVLRVCRLQGLLFPPNREASGSLAQTTIRGRGHGRMTVQG